MWRRQRKWDTEEERKVETAEKVPDRRGRVRQKRKRETEEEG
jgi:hypothetical protein